MIDPSDVADQLPNRPLRPAEAEALTDRLDWSAMPVVHETPDGAEYVPEIYCYEEDSRRAIALVMTDALDTWEGKVPREDIDRGTWLEANQAFAAEMSGELSVESMTLDDGQQRRFEDREDE